MNKIIVVVATALFPLLFTSCQSIRYSELDDTKPLKVKFSTNGILFNRFPENFSDSFRMLLEDTGAEICKGGKKNDIAIHISFIPLPFTTTQYIGGGGPQKRNERFYITISDNKGEILSESLYAFSYFPKYYRRDQSGPGLLFPSKQEYERVIKNSNAYHTIGKMSEYCLKGHVNNK